MKRISTPLTRSLRTVMIGLGLLAAGCTGIPGERIYNVTYISYTPSNFRSMAAAGAPIEIFGAPPGGASAEQVVEAIRMPARLNAASPRLAEIPGQGQRLVFAFGLAGPVTGEALCAGAVVGSTLPDRLEVAGAFCRGERMLTRANMTAPGPVGPPDPRFTESMRRLIETLGPRTDPNRDNSRRDCTRPGCN